MQPPHAIIGHERVLLQLQQDLLMGRRAHAYLFYGKRHLGKFSVARWFAAQALMHGMEEKQRKSTLHLIEHNLHPDLLILDQLWIDGVCTDWNIIAQSSNVPQQHRAKARVKTDTIGIDDIRALQERLYTTAQTGTFCCLIRSIERLHVTAANALLKILEEPPPSVLFCCTTESLSSLPPTVVSRMRVLPFFPVRKSELQPLLSDLSPEDRSLVLSIAEGAPGLVRRCVENPQVMREYRQVQIDALRFLDSFSPLARLQQLSALLKDGKERTFLHLLFLHLHGRLRSPDPLVALRAQKVLQQLFLLLHNLQSNTQTSLLALQTTLHIP